MLKQKTLIAIMGNHNQGKTETLNEVFNLINSLPDAIIIHNIVGINPRDITERINKIGGYYIGILDGDFPNPMVASIKDFIERKCDIVICRTLYNNGDKIVNPFIDKYVHDKEYRIFRMANYSTPFPSDKRTATPLQKELNQYSAKQIFDTVKIILEGIL